MPYPTPFPVRLADEIARQLGLLTDQLSQAPADQAAQILGRVVDADTGVLGRVTTLIATGSRFAQEQAERGSLPAEVWLALGRAANEMDSISLDLDEHTEAIKSLSTPSAAPATTMAAASAASPLVVRRHR
ncbi:hypothetical protein GCM10009654_15390 [Streptomyces hebeiensis]|uniref:Uncharacterized protein n=1 Tax=Streptomyces hebeiensis TaxID=229486 RepID=A0ABP4F7R9_9ACTN